MNLVKSAFILSLLLTSALVSQAQQELTLRNMTRLGQVSQTNPAIFPDKTVNFTVIPSFAFNFANSGFTYEDIFQVEDDTTLILDMDNLSQSLKDKNFIYTHLNVDWLNLGIRFNKLYFNLTGIDKFQANIKYPKQFMSLLIDGNAANLGEDLELGWKLDVNYYREIGLGAAYQFDKFNIGAKVKYLQGMINVNTERSKINMNTSADDYSLRLETDLLINTAGVDTTPGEITDLITDFNNTGFAVDLGIEYRLNDRITLRASVLDLGGINWKSWTSNYVSSDTAVYSGLDMAQVIFQDTSGGQSTEPGGGLNVDFNPLFDSLASLFNIEKTHAAYKTRLIPKVYIGGTYAIDSSIKVGGLIYGDFFDGFNPALALMAQKQFGNIFTLQVNYNIKNNSYFNFGLGWVLQLGPVQLYMVGDNASALFFPEKAKNFNFRTGLQFAFGKHKDRDAVEGPVMPSIELQE